MLKGSYHAARQLHSETKYSKTLYLSYAFYGTEGIPCVVEIGLALWRDGMRDIRRIGPFECCMNLDNDALLRS